MAKSLDRIEFYEQLDKCKSTKEIEDLIDIIDNEELYAVILDKYQQILEFNRNKNDDKLVKNIIKILQFTYLNFERKHQNEE